MLSPSDFLSKRLQRDGLSGVKVLRNFVPDPRRTQSLDTAPRDSILYLGMLEPHKGPQTLLEAFHRTRENQGFQLYLVGDGTLRERLKSRVNEMGMRDRVEVTGFLPRKDLDMIRRTAAAQVIPSEWPENAPLTALEALALGTPLIGSDYGGLPEILKPENGCRMFKGGDVDDLARSLSRLWEERKDNLGMRDKARKAYESEYTPERHLRLYMELIRGTD